MPIKRGEVESDRIAFEFIEYDPLPEGFRAIIREGSLDVAEMALVTHLLAKKFGKPLTAIAVPVWGRLHHSNLICLATSALRGPKDLENRKVGVRAYSQTTGVWIRGILKTKYGVDLDSITWVTLEDSHVAEHRDPANVIRDTSGRNLRELLHAGEVVAIMGERNVEPQSVRTVIPDADRVGQEWARQAGVFPINHIISVKSELISDHPWLGGELMRVFEEARARSVASGVTALPYGFEANRASMQMLCGFAADQKLTESEYQVADLFWREAGE